MFLYISASDSCNFINTSDYIMRTLTIAFFLILISTSLNAQDAELQQYKNELSRALHQKNNDSIAAAYCHLGEYYAYRQADSARYYCEEGLKYTGRDNPQLYLLLLNNLADTYSATGEIDDAINHFLKVRDEALSLQCEDELLSTILTSIGVQYRRKAMPDSALVYYNRALELLENGTAYDEQAHLLTSMAILYANTSRLSEGELYARRAMVVRMQEEETLSSGVVEISGNTFTYKDNIILMQSFSNDESDEYDEATLTLGADGNISVFEINEFEKINSRSWYTAGSLSYNEEGNVIRADMKVEASNGEIENQVDLATWENGNMVKVYDDAYGVDHEKTVTTLSYDNPAYVNNTNINLDLNYLICDSEWLDCWAFSGSYIKHYGFMGKRSKNYMTKEYDVYNQEYCTYTYDFNDEGLPVKIVKTRHERFDYFSKSVVTYTITYSTPVK